MGICLLRRRLVANGMDHDGPILRRGVAPVQDGRTRYVIGRNGERVRVGSRDCAKLDAEGAF